MNKLIVTTFVSGLALAISVAPAAAEPAEVLRDQFCVQFDSSGATFVSDANVTVFTNSENGNITFTCKSKGVLNTTGKVQKFNFANTGFTCFGQTDWEQVLTPSGIATTRCHAKF